MDKARKLTRLLDHTEELLAGIADQHAADVVEVRDRLLASLSNARAAIAEEPPDHPIKVRHLAGSLNDYVRSYPWLALATGVLLASSIGIMTTGAAKRSVR